MEIHRLGTRGDRRQRVVELLELVGLHASHADRYPPSYRAGSVNGWGLPAPCRSARNSSLRTSR
jgi:hypothetical protein